MRYFSQFGSYPKLEAAIHISGPQNEDQVLAEIRAILEREGIQRVAVFFNHGQGERVHVFERITEPTGARP